MSSSVLSLAAWIASWLPMPLKRFAYGFKPLANVIRSSLNRAAPEGFTVVSVAAGGVQGFKLLLDLHAEKDYWLGTYEPELQAVIAETARPGMVAYDVGANIGYISLLLAHKVGSSGKVYAFEALPANLERLRANLELNSLQAHVAVVPAAVVEQSGPVQFLTGPSIGMGKAAGSAGRRDVAYREAITVEGISLDEFVFGSGNLPPQMVKMDIEGGELLALPGMKRLLVDIRPLMLLELHGPEAVQGVWEIFTETGYRICSMRPGYPSITSPSDILDWKAYVVAFPHGK